MKAKGLLERHDTVWHEATSHPFLETVREGTINHEAFATWLVQDYLFVNDLLVFQVRLFAKAPRPDQEILARGLAALEAELSWFAEQAERRGLALDVPRHPTNAAYVGFLMGLERDPYPAGIIALWALEQAYLDTWKGAAPGHPDYREFVGHWTTPEFADYVAGLEKAADAALHSARRQELERAEDAFLKVARLERSFWEMSSP